MASYVFHLGILAIISSSAICAEMKVSVDVYYESLCPDSIKFITKQLAPVRLSNLGKYMKLDLIPFGKSSMSFNNDTYTFSCHHGPRECYGNKIQACALDIVKDVEKQFKFINCTMGEVNKNDDQMEYPTQMCAEMFEIQADGIIECANSTNGDKLLYNMGEKTQSFQNPLRNIPAIALQQNFNENDQKMSTTNFKQALCSHIKGDKPSECGVSPSTAASIATTLLPIAGALLLSRL